MPPHLHPRSRFTSTLFGTTLLVSFLVVGMPHILPCPVPRTDFADSELVVAEDGTRRRWRRRQKTNVNAGGEGDRDSRLEEGRELMGTEEEVLTLNARECPVPKPGGLIGQVLGFRESDGVRKSRVIVDEVKDRRDGGKK